MVTRLRGAAVGRHWRKKELARRLGVASATLDRWRRQGKFPRGIRLSPQVVVWPDETVAAFLRQREVDGECGGTND